MNTTSGTSPKKEYKRWPLIQFTAGSSPYELNVVQSEQNTSLEPAFGIQNQSSIACGPRLQNVCRADSAFISTTDSYFSSPFCGWPAIINSPEVPNPGFSLQHAGYIETASGQRTDESVLIADSDSFKERLLAIMDDENYVSGENSPSEMFVEEMLQRQGRRWTMEQLERISDENRDCPHTLIGILHMLSHFPYAAVEPFGPRTAEKLLTHKSEAVRDFAVKAFENWESKETLPVLKTVKYEEPWLQEYLDAVISELERE